jgi:hypothetical protein
VNEKTFLYNSNTFNRNIPYLYDTYFSLNNYTGYLPNDPLILINPSQINSFSSFRIPILTPYGKCKNNLDTARFMQNKQFVCSNTLSYNLQNCLNFNSNNFNLDNKMSLLSYNSSDNTFQYITSSTVINNVTDKLYYTQVTNKNFNTPGFNNFIKTDSQCQCSNIITGVDYEFGMLNDTIKFYKITYYVENLKNDCSKIEYIPV